MRSDLESYTSGGQDHDITSFRPYEPGEENILPFFLTHLTAILYLRWEAEGKECINALHKMRRKWKVKKTSKELANVVRYDFFTFFTGILYQR